MVSPHRIQLNKYTLCFLNSASYMMLGSDCMKDKQKEHVVIEIDLHLLSFTFIAVHNHLLIKFTGEQPSMPYAGVCVCVLDSTL